MRFDDGSRLPSLSFRLSDGVRNLHTNECVAQSDWIVNVKRIIIIEIMSSYRHDDGNTCIEHDLHEIMSKVGLIIDCVA